MLVCMATTRIKKQEAAAQPWCVGDQEQRHCGLTQKGLANGPAWQQAFVKRLARSETMAMYSADVPVGLP